MSNTMKHLIIISSILLLTLNQLYSEMPNEILGTWEVDTEKSIMLKFHHDGLKHAHPKSIKKTKNLIEAMKDVRYTIDQDSITFSKGSFTHTFPIIKLRRSSNGVLIASQHNMRFFMKTKNESLSIKMTNRPDLKNLVWKRSALAIASRE